MFVGGLVHKIKKPVALPFVDLSTPAARLGNCLRELELNRAIAPDVYLGLSELYPLYLPGAVGEPVLVMRRMPSARRLSTVLDRGEDPARWLADVAGQVAALHRREPALEGFGLARTMRDLWRESREQLTPFEDVLTPAGLDAVAALAEEYLAGRSGLLDDRERSGLVRAGHGDLLVGRHLLPATTAPRILDCLEFDERLRGGDVLMDAAFLAMDLEAHGHAEAGHRVPGPLRGGQRHGRTREPRAPLHRLPRVRPRQGREPPQRARSARRARRRPRRCCTLCRDHLDAGRVHLVCWAGCPAAGSRPWPRPSRRTIPGTARG